MQLVGAGLRDDIEDPAAGPSEFSAEVAGLHGNLCDGVGNGKYLIFARQVCRIVFGTIEHVIVPARPLAVDREPGAGTRHVAPDLATRSLRHAGQHSRERKRIGRDQWQIAHFARLKVTPRSGLSITSNSRD